MYYDLPTEITSSQCWYLSTPYNIIAYPNNRTRRQYVRSGATWYLQSTQTTSSSMGYDWSQYNCLRNTKIEYEYSGFGVVYGFIAFVISATAIYFAYKITIGRLFKGGFKW